MSTFHCDEQSCLLQEGTPDEEDRTNAAPFAPDSKNTPINTEKIESDDSGITTQSPTITRGDDGGLEHDDEVEYEDTLPVVDLDRLDASLRGPHHDFVGILSSSFLPPSDDIQAYRYYRMLPILSSITIPLCILLDIPGLLTADWYIRTNHFTIVGSKPNPPLLNVGTTLSVLCAILANLCLVIRFLERRIKRMTILCILFLAIHDTINVATLVALGAIRNDYTYCQAFWMTLCSSIVSTFTNMTLIVDFIQTPDFARSGSGLSRRQRSLAIIIIGLFSYIVLGALVNSILLELTFIDGLYFTAATITTIGLGDIVPKSTSSRIFICVYATLGVIGLAFVVGYVHGTVLESLDFGYRGRLLAVQEKRRAARLRRRVEKRWRHGVIWRLRGEHAPVWIQKKTNDCKSVWSKLMSCFQGARRGIRSTARRSTQGPHGMQLNLWALSPYQLEAAAFEAGAPLYTLLPANFYDTYNQRSYHHTLRSLPVVNPTSHREERPTEPSTHRWLGTMAAMLTKVSIAVYESGGSTFRRDDGVQNASLTGLPEAASGSLGNLETRDGDYREDVEGTEKKAYYTRSSLSGLWLLIFWMGGAALFRATEGWTYGLAIYFCFVSFTAIGYGDLAPSTPAGRSIFVVWALIDVAIVTIFISVVSEAYTTRYKDILARNSFKHVIRRYRDRENIKLNKLVQCKHASGQVFPDTFERVVAQAGGAELEDELPPTGDSTTLSVVSSSQLDEHVRRAQQSLESLPRQILAEARSIQQYMQLISNLDGCTVEAEKFAVLAEKARSLVNDALPLGGKELMDGSKDTLKEAESCRTPMLLGIERSVKLLVDMSEQAIIAIQERDRIIARLK